MSEAPVKRSRWLVVCLTLIPLWLALSAGAAVWWSLRDDRQEKEERQQRFVREMSVERIADDMRKLDEAIGPRNAENPESLMRAAAMIDGTLGPSNTGYQTKRIPGPTEAPIIRASLKQSKNQGRSIWIVASYDTVPESQSISDNSSSVAAMMAAAQAMARDDLPTDIHFLFFPCGNDTNSVSGELAKTLLTIMDRPNAVFYLGDMQTGRNLVALSSLNADSPQARSLGELGSYAKDGAMVKAAGEIQAAGLPTLYIMGVDPEGDQAGSTMENIAICTGKLVEWLRRAARLSAQD